MNLRDKIVGRADLPSALARLQGPLVFTNGVFDLLHPGHVTYLHQARALGAALFVGLNSDSSTRLLEKGTDRPFCGEDDRALMLAGLASVDAVCLFDERTPLALMAEVRPDIYVKGGDYDVDRLPEAALVRSWGGTAKRLDFLPGFSTTRLVKRIRSPER